MSDLMFDAKELMCMQEEYVTCLSEVREIYREYKYAQKGNITDEQVVRLTELKEKIDDLYVQFPDDVKAMYTPVKCWWIN